MSGAGESSGLLEENRRLRAQLEQLQRREPNAPLTPLVPAALDAMREGLQILSFDWKYIYINEAGAQHGRRSKHELIGGSMLELYPGIEQTDVWQRLDRSMRERVPQRFENEFTYPNGLKEWFELSVEPVPEGLLVLSIDMSKQRKLEAQLAHAQKMDALSRLAGGVAHDFNNLLTVIISYSQFMAAEMSEGSTLRKDVNEIQAAAERGARLTRQLLALSRRQVIEPRVLSVPAALRELEPMLRRLLGEAIEVNLQLAPLAGAIRADPGQLDQVLLNLATNARDAMAGGGKLTLRCENVTLDPSYAEQHPEVTPGPHVMIAVSDSGCGMDAATLARLFEPFFTTKPAGQGTGLGLATSHGIVRQSGGHIWVYSEPGRGTTFKLYFPRVLEQAEQMRAPMSAAPTELRGQEVVMVVEDEAALRALCVRALTNHGYTVFEAESPAEALRFSAHYSGPIHAVISDVVMPEMSGPTLAAQLLRGRPDLKLLFMSGYADHSLLDRVGAGHYLEKPFTPRALVRKLREVLVMQVTGLELE